MTLFFGCLCLSLPLKVNIKAKRYIQTSLCVVAALVIGMTILLNSSKVQQQVAITIASELENRIGTRVNIGEIHWLFPSSLIIDDLTVNDQKNEQLLAVNRIATKVEWIPLVKHGQLSIRNIRLFEPDINLYKVNADGEMNYQFLVDAFTAKERKEKKSKWLNLRVNSLLIRKASVKYDVHSEKVTPGIFNRHHIDVNNLSAMLSLKELTNDSISMIVRSMQCTEHSGAKIEDLYLRFVGNRHGATLGNFHLKLPNSSLRFDTLWFDYSPDDFFNSLIVKGSIPPSRITPSDLGSFIPTIKDFKEPIHVGGEAIASKSQICIKGLEVYTHHKDFSLQANLTTQIGRTFSLDLDTLNATPQMWQIIKEQLPKINDLMPVEITRTGGIAANGSAHLSRTDSHINLLAQTDVGKIEAYAQIDTNGQYQIKADGSELNVSELIPTSPLTRTNLNIYAEGAYDREKQGTFPLNGNFEAKVTHAEIMGYTYKELVVNGNYSPDNYEAMAILNEPNGAFKLKVAYDLTQRTPTCSLTLKADSLDLYAMNLIKIHKGKSVSFQINGDMRGHDIDHLTGKISIDSLILHEPKEDYIIKQIALYASDPKQKLLSLHADFMDASMSGDFTWRSFKNSLIQHIHHSVPSLCCNNQHVHHPQENLCVANIKVYNATPLQRLLLLPIKLEKTATAELLINDHTGIASLTATLPQLHYGEMTLSGADFNLQSDNVNATLCTGGTLELVDTPPITANITANANADHLTLGTLWHSNPTGFLNGAFHAKANFYSTSNTTAATIEGDSSFFIINHAKWDLTPFKVNIAPNHIEIEDFRFDQNEKQHIAINGSIGENLADTLCVELRDMDLNYLLTLVRLKGISFGGQVSGHIHAANLFADEPYLNADVEAKKFSFCDGVMGDTKAQAYWNQDSERLEFQAYVNETPQHTSVVDGIADFKNDELWINVNADSLNASFLNNILGNFMHDIKGHATGQLLIGGPTNAIDLKGALMTDASLVLTPTNAEYHINDSIRFVPGTISFTNIEGHDNRGQKAIINGIITHNALKDFSYDLHIDAQNVLGIDLPNTGSDDFYTTIYGTGDVHVYGSPQHPLTIDIRAITEKNSIFALNLGDNNVRAENEFITFRNPRASNSLTQNFYKSDISSVGNLNDADILPETSSTININANITPEATLKLVMNQAADDHISVTGQGDIQVDIDGDEINLFGTYAVSRGFYRLSLQDVINKNFDVLTGSTITFEGDPMASRLDITARHIVNYVPFKDLSPELTGNVRVNCLLHIGGTLSNPQLTFSLELPQGTEEQKAILRSYTSTDEQTNLQFIYLLGLGKFYTMNLAQQGMEENNNMESFISTTISGQINNLLSNIISSDNWNFASNIRTENLMGQTTGVGTNNGFENMEIEGMLEGRLLNNRLLINGNFGYRDNPMYATNFIGDFDIRYLLRNDFSLKGYNKTNDRYFTKTSLTTQGIGLVFQRDFSYLFPRCKKVVRQRP